MHRVDSRDDFYGASQSDLQCNNEALEIIKVCPILTIL
jgi:hypothetical protein